MRELAHVVFAVAYAALTVGCVLSALRERRIGRSGVYPAVWILFAVLLFAITAQQANGFLTHITSAARHEARLEGWYRQRGGIQEMAVTRLPVAVVVLVAGAFWLLRRALGRYLPALLAMGYLVAFYGIQGISWHRIDALMRVRVVLPLQVWGDLAGVFLALFALWWAASVRSCNNLPFTVEQRR